MAVVDRGGELVAFARMDGSSLLSVRIAQDKAWTAAADPGCDSKPPIEDV